MSGTARSANARSCSRSFDILVAVGLPVAIVGGHSITGETAVAMVLLLGITIASFVVLGRRRALGRREAVALCVLYAVFGAALTAAVWR